MKVKAVDANEAEATAWRELQRTGRSLRFVIGNAYTLSEFHQFHPGWRGLI